MAEAILIQKGTSYYDKVQFPLSPLRAGAVQDPKRNRETELYARYKFPGKGPVIYKKYFNENRDKSDFIPDRAHPFNEQCTDLPAMLADVRSGPERIQVVLDNDDIVPVELQHGFILNFKGYAGQEVGIDPRTGVYLDEEQVDIVQEQVGKELLRLREWVFHLDEIIFTDGPELTARRKESNEAQRNRAEARMFEQQGQLYQQQAALFASLMEQMAKMAGGGVPVVDGNLSSFMKEKLKELPKESLQDLAASAQAVLKGK